MPVLTSLLRRNFEVFSALQHRGFRLYWAGLLVQVTGQQMMMVTMGWLAFHLTGSPLALGVVNLLQALPRIALNLLGGALADRFDQRLIIAVSQTLSAIVLVGLAFLTVADLVRLWHLMVGAFLIGLVQSLDEPSRQSLFPRLLPDRTWIPRAVPLIGMAWQLNRIIAPTIAGFAIGLSGAGLSFFLSAVGAAVMAAAMRLLRLRRVARATRGGMLQTLVEGATYASKEPVFRVVIGTAFLNSLLAQGYSLMLPVFAADVHRVDASGLGLMYSVTGVGAIAALFTVNRWMRRLRPGWVVLLSLVAFQASLIAFAFAPGFLIALAALTLVGYAQFTYLAGSEIVLQSRVPDQLRGRVMGLWGMLWSLMPLGAALLGGIAEVSGAPVALAIGAGGMLVYVGLVAARSKDLRSARVPTPEAVEDGT